MELELPVNFFAADHRVHGGHKAVATMTQVAAERDRANQQKDTARNDLSFVDQLATLQDTVASLEREHKENMAALDSMYTTKLTERMQHYEKLMAKQQGLIRQRLDLLQTHARLVKASNHLD